MTKVMKSVRRFDILSSLCADVFKPHTQQSVDLTYNNTLIHHFYLVQTLWYVDTSYISHDFCNDTLFRTTNNSSKLEFLL